MSTPAGIPITEAMANLAARSLPEPHYDPTREENRTLLRERFLERLMGLRPGSVLDIGCGGGELAAGLRRKSVSAVGIEIGRETATQALTLGIPVVRGSAVQLPFPSDAFDWACLRHVLHHLEDPGAALQEAWRICRKGVAVAEPWFDTRIPSQALSARAERWLRGLQRRAGRVHGRNLDADSVLSLLPQARRAEAETAFYLRLKARSLADFRWEAEPLLFGIPDDAPEREEYRRLLERIPNKGLSWPGSMVIVLRKSA